MRINRIALMVAASFAAVPLHSAAAEEYLLLYENEEMISIATGTAKPIHLAPSVASVITARQIEASGARTLDEVLETVPGLHVSRSSNRNNAIYSIRGIHTDWNPQVLLLVNGMPFNDLITGARPPLFRLPLENISRIEVMRGPGSAVYGADAFSGVINVITKEGGEIKGSTAGGRVGSFDSRDVWLQHGSRGVAGWDVGLSLEYSDSEGDRDRIVTSDAQRGFDALFGTSASLTPGPLENGYRLLNSSITATREHWAVWFNSWNLSDAGVGPGVAQALDPAGRQMVDQYTLKVDYSEKRLGSDLRLDSSFSYRVMDQQVDFRILPPGARVPIGADGNLFSAPSAGNACSSPTSHPVLGPVCLVDFPDGVWGNPGGELSDMRFEVSAYYQGWLDHKLRLAIGADRDEFSPVESKNFGPGVIDGSVSPIGGALTDVSGTANIFVQQRERTVGYLSLQDEWRFGRDWELVGGVRYDDYSDFGDTTNPRLALIWATDYNLTTKLLYGRAFRAPSLTELYFENNLTVIGNPDLKPERIDMVELVFDYRPTFDLETVFSLFAYEADDLIEFVNFKAQNSRNQEGHGLELEAQLQVTREVQLKGNFALQYSQDATSGEVIANAPRRQLFAALNWRFIGDWSFYSQANWVADRARAANDSRPAVPDYTTLDLALRYQPYGQPWEAALSARNAFDRDIREPSDGVIADDYPGEGRAVYLKALYRL